MTLKGYNTIVMIDGKKVYIRYVRQAYLVDKNSVIHPCVVDCVPHSAEDHVGAGC